MFSSIRYIFGYADETEVASSEATSANQPGESLSVDHEKPLQSRQQAALSHSSSSASLEQALNTATTIFTEQLMPPQASLEQLQSSSQQLLPSILEQHEEEKLKAVTTNLVAEVEDQDEDDDDCLEVDSWELLDLVDSKSGNQNQEVLDVAVQMDSKSQTCKATTSGILKTKNKNKISLSTGNNFQQEHQQQRPKVSFETPDLVNNSSKNYEKIEQQQVEEEVQKTGHIDIPKAKAKGKKKKNQQKLDVIEFVEKIAGNNIETTKKKRESKVKLSCEQNLSGKGDRSDDGIICPAKIPSVTTKSTSLNSETNTIEHKIQKPVLNYAAALSKKPAQQYKKESEERNIVKEEGTIAGSNKRIRGLSSSSWSSSDEMWPETTNKSIGTRFDESCFLERDSDSSDSREFSDCDYGYEGINDYYLRPKQASSQTKEDKWHPRHYNTISKTSLNSHSKRGPNKEQHKPLEVSRSPKAPIAKNVDRTKKKKISLSVPTNSQDYLRKISVHDHTTDPVAENTTSDTIYDQLTTVTMSSNDSSDIAEMDESWYVTPPPCFTGSKRISEDQPKARQSSARENELIEHPSIPISSKTANLIKANASKQVDDKHLNKVTSKDNVWDMDDYDDDVDSDMENDIWFPGATRIKFNKHWRETLSGQEQSGKSEVKAASPSLKSSKPKTSKKVTGANSKTDSKKSAAWKNKFSVDDWDFDDREDVDSDFDQMFEPVKKKKETTKAKRQQKKKQSEKTPIKENLDLFVDDIESDTSIDLAIDLMKVADVQSETPSSGAELISVRSSPSFDSPMNLEDKENRVGKSISVRRPPTLVRPIEPERRPGWQLKRQRPKRRPLTGPATVPTTTTVVKRGISRQFVSSSVKREDSDESSSSRSTPTLIDRIGSTIVANINNLTNGLVSSGALHSAASSPLVEESARATQSSQTDVSQPLASDTCNLNVRKRMSKGFLKRQNDCVKKANSQRRPGRQLKMFATPNGCSINRKIQSNFH